MTTVIIFPFLPSRVDRLTSVGEVGEHAHYTHAHTQYMDNLHVFFDFANCLSFKRTVDENVSSLARELEGGG